MRFSISPVRTAAVIALVVVVSGCHWFHKGDKLAGDQLEVPPKLDLAASEAENRAPVASSASAIAPAAPVAGAVSTTAFTVAGDRSSVYTRVGEALAGIEGVTIVGRAQLLGTYDVTYQGSSFLIRVADSSNGAQVSALDPRGVDAVGAAPINLIAALKAKLR